MRFAKIVAAALLLGLAAHPASAEANKLRAAKQYGLGYVQFMIMEDMKLVEKQAKAAGLGDIQVEWNTFRSSDVMNDALLSGNVDFVSLGIAGMMTIWDRTKGTIDVRGVTGINSMPIALNVRNPDVKSLKDFTEKDRIAMPAVGVSNQAILLRMACEKEFGPGQHSKLDHLTITMSHPDATIAMLTGQKDVTANFSSVPFQYRQQKQAGIRELMTSTDILGAPFSFNIIAATAKFRAENPKLYASFLAALKEATEMVNKDRKWAAEAYLRISKDKMPIEELMEIMNRPDLVFTTKLTGADPMILFMARTGNFKNKPTGVKELLFPEAEM
ncbi:MAG: ABC transporter substrate-binding protein [Bacteroidota bacterium]|jgi:NitT/TauT family transport system substrate-binding protein